MAGEWGFGKSGPAWSVGPTVVTTGPGQPESVLAAAPCDPPHLRKGFYVKRIEGQAPVRCRMTDFGLFHTVPQVDLPKRVSRGKFDRRFGQSVKGQFSVLHERTGNVYEKKGR